MRSLRIGIMSQNNLNKKNKKFRIPNKVFNVLRIFVLLIAGGAMAYASYNLTDSYLEYKEDEAKYAEINQMFTQTEDSQNTNTNTGVKGYSADTSNWKWDYKAMLKYNDEARGYIKLDGTRIQYPIVEHEDNEFYLNHGSDKVSNGAGAIFIDHRTQGLEGNMCIVYGHNMLDGSMFKDIMNFRDKKFCKKHPTFDVYVGYKHYIYYVYSTFSSKATDDDIYTFGFEKDSDFQNWINRTYSKSSYRFSCPKPTTSDKIIMLSTCIDDNLNRQLVCLYRGEEVVD